MLFFIGNQLKDIFDLKGMSLVKGYLNYKENKSQYANQTRPVVSFVAQESPAMKAGNSL